MATRSEIVEGCILYIRVRKGPFQCVPARNLGPINKVCQLYIEGISRSKCKVLQNIIIQNEIDVVTKQETHTVSEDDLRCEGKIPEYDLLGAAHHYAYGVATYVRTSVENALLCSTSDLEEIHKVIIQIGAIAIDNMYKPPTISWPAHVITASPHPAVYHGDFNSHHTQGKYRDINENGEMLASWAEDNNLNCIFDAKDRATLKSTAWKRKYNPDLCGDHRRK